MSRSIRAVALSLTLLGSLLLAAGPAAATSHQPTGNRLNLITADGTTYPAQTAFFVRHGVFFDPGDPSAGLVRFTLDVDGVARKASYVESTSYPDGSLNTRLWFFNFPTGLVGTHTLTGHYLFPCGPSPLPDCAGQPRNSYVEVFTLTATVTFS